MIETIQTFYSKTKTTWVITHKGFRRILSKSKDETLKDETTYYLNHQIGCECLNE